MPNIITFVAELPPELHAILGGKYLFKTIIEPTFPDEENYGNGVSCGLTNSIEAVANSPLYTQEPEKHLTTVGKVFLCTNPAISDFETAPMLQSVPITGCIHHRVI